MLEREKLRQLPQNTAFLEMEVWSPHWEEIFLKLNATTEMELLEKLCFNAKAGKWPPKITGDQLPFPTPPFPFLLTEGSCKVVYGRLEVQVSTVLEGLEVMVAFAAEDYPFGGRNVADANNFYEELLSYYRF